MARAIDLAGTDDILIAARKDEAQELFGSTWAPADTQVEIACDDSTIVMPLAIKAIWDEWIGK